MTMVYDHLPLGNCQGIITDGDVRRAMQNSQDKFFKLTVADIMSKNPKCVTPETKIHAIEKLFQQHKIHCVLVTDENNHLVGLVDSFSTML